MNDTSSQLCFRLEPALQNELTQLSVFDQWCILVHDPVAVREIPVKISMHRWVIEICKRA